VGSGLASWVLWVSVQELPAVLLLVVGLLLACLQELTAVMLLVLGWLLACL
jgi:hypothetical protein